MNVKMNTGRHVLVLAVPLGLTPIAFVTWGQSKRSREHEDKTVTITGCMTKGESGGRVRYHSEWQEVWAEEYARQISGTLRP